MLLLLPNNIYFVESVCLFRGNFYRHSMDHRSIENATRSREPFSLDCRHIVIRETLYLKIYIHAYIRIYFKNSMFLHRLWCIVLYYIILYYEICNYFRCDRGVSFDCFDLFQSFYFRGFFTLRSRRFR